MGIYNVGRKEDRDSGLELIAFESKILFETVKSTVTNVRPKSMA